MLEKDGSCIYDKWNTEQLPSVLAHCNLGEEIIVGETYHITGDEAGGVSVLGGVAMNTIPVEKDGSLCPKNISNAINLMTSL